jgi:hypothetical protein
MATAKPPKVIVLMPSPMTLKASAAPSRVTGMVMSVMAVVRTFIKKRKRMMATMIAPSLNASSTFEIAASMKCDCLNRSLSTFTPFGSSL